MREYMATSFYDGFYCVSQGHQATKKPHTYFESVLGDIANRESATHAWNSQVQQVWSYKTNQSFYMTDTKNKEGYGQA